MELNLTANAPGADLIKDVSEATFMTDVVEASQTTPVIVDFWAPWCGPCKTLGPQLEAAVTAAKGAVKMVKINVDEAQRIAGQLQIQSIPTVYAFHKGQPIDGFQGALPESEIKAFVDKVIKAAGGSAPGDALAEAVEAAEEMLAEGAAADAAQTFAAILGEDPMHAGAYGGMVRAHIAMGELDQAEGLLNGAPIEISKAAGAKRRAGCRTDRNSGSGTRQPSGKVRPGPGALCQGRCRTGSQPASRSVPPRPRMERRCRENPAFHHLRRAETQ